MPTHFIFRAKLIPQANGLHLTSQTSLLLFTFHLSESAFLILYCAVHSPQEYQGLLSFLTSLISIFRGVDHYSPAPPHIVSSLGFQDTTVMGHFWAPSVAFPLSDPEPKGSAFCPLLYLPSFPKCSLSFSGFKYLPYTHFQIVFNLQLWPLL